MSNSKACAGLVPHVQNVSKSFAGLRSPAGLCQTGESYRKSSSDSSESVSSNSPLPSQPPRLIRTKARAGIELIGIESNPGPKNQAQKSKKNSSQGKSIQSKPKAVVKARASRPAVSIAERVGSSVGGFLGKAASSVIGSIFGMGDYTVAYNSLHGAGGPPQFSGSGTRSTVVTHREFVGDITGSTTFTSTRYAITPSNSQLFPWLSEIAQNYEEYRIHGMILEFKTTSGTSVSSTNTALGTVVMATQYNPNDQAFSSKIEMENYEFGTSGAPFENFLHPIECKPGLTVAPQLYVRQPSYALSVNDDKLTTFGQFTIATVGMQAANVIGELWISYQIELIKPRLSTLVSGPGYVTLSSTTGLPGSAAFTNAFGSAPTIVATTQTNGAPGPFTGFATNPALPASSYPSIYYVTSLGTINFSASVFASRTVLLSCYYTGTTFSTNQSLTAGSEVTITALQNTSSATTNTYLWSITFPAATVTGTPYFVVTMTTPTSASFTRVDAALMLAR